jgi:glycosyltransferase involved in cell wall biosynthesis
MSQEVRRDHDSQVRVSRVSAATGDRPRWSVAVFAHNEAARIRKAIEAIAAAVDDPRDIDVWVLANGCADGTAEQVRGCAAIVRNLWLVDISLADKANAWNVYVHEVLAAPRAGEIELHVFTDGDVTLEPAAIGRLAQALEEMPRAEAAGGMPATGRDRVDWRRRMARNGVLAGNLYALRGRFVQEVRDAGVRLPVGLIGEDLLVSQLVLSALGQGTAAGAAGRMIFCPDAEFSFRSLSPLQAGDWRIYARRKWRYTLRALQLEMLMHVLARGGIEAMPRHVEELYREAPLPSRLRWDGVDTPLRLLAVLGIRRHRHAAR